MFLKIQRLKGYILTGSSKKYNGIIGYLVDGASKCPKQIAYSIDGVDITYCDFHDYVGKLVKGLQLNGAKKGDHLVMMLDNSLEFVALMFAASDMGLVLIPVPPSISPSALLKVVEITNTSWIIGLSRILNKHNGLFQKLNNKKKVKVVSVGQRCDFALSWDDFLEHGLSAFIGKNQIDKDSAFIVTMTSGSTGSPKPIILSQSVKELRAKSAIEAYKLVEGEVVLACTPLYHSLAMRLAILPIMLKGTGYIMRRFNPHEWQNIVEKYSITFSMMVSTQLDAIANNITSNEAMCNINSLHCLVSSSALLRSSVKEKLVDKLECVIHECYGTSELGVVTSMPLIKDSCQIASVGKAVNGVEIAILDQMGIVTKNENIRGQIVCKSKMICSGYFEVSKLNFDAIITFDADGQHDSKNIPLFISKLEEGFDLILGVRPKTQRISEWLFKRYMKRRFDWSDPLCGFKGYSMKLDRDRGWFDSYKSIGTELAIYGIVNNYKHVEITISTSPRIDKPRFSSIVTSNLLIIKSMFKSFRVD